MDGHSANAAPDPAGAPGFVEITRSAEHFPPLLREIADPPRQLYVAGNPELLRRPQLAIVGSRRSSPSGQSQARRFATGLSRAGLVVTSGLASGIDTAAHVGALAGPTPTLAVMGTGPDRVYPARNRELAARIVDAGGALVTEYPPGTPPRPYHFPQRNRIISGLSLGVLVVEASERSGSLITARLALEQGREVFAVPGNVDSPLARGCHRLIRDGAALVESIEDVLCELGSLLEFQLERQLPAGDDATDDTDDPVLSALGWDPASADLLAERSGLPLPELLDRLLELELAGEVVAAAGSYQRVAKE